MHPGKIYTRCAVLPGFIRKDTESKTNPKGGPKKDGLFNIDHIVLHSYNFSPRSM